MSKSAPQPRSRKTPIGGTKMAKMILMMSLYTHVSARFLVMQCTRFALLTARRLLDAAADAPCMRRCVPAGESHGCCCWMLLVVLVVLGMVLLKSVSGLLRGRREAGKKEALIMMHGCAAASYVTASEILSWPAVSLAMLTYSPHGPGD